MPHVRNPVNLPLGLTSNVPLEVVGRVVGRVTVDPAILHFGKVGFEKVDLVLIVRVGSIGVGLFHREVVVKSTRAEVSLGLGDELSPKVTVLV